MNLEDRKLAIRKEIERKKRYLETLEAMPDWDRLVDGTVVALSVTYGSSRPYAVVAYKAGNSWHLTGSKSPNGVSGADLSEWLMSQGRHLRSADVLAEFTVEPVSEFDLGAALLETMRDSADRRGSEWKVKNEARIADYDECSERGL